MRKTYCLYLHLRADRLEPFYVGIGSEKRAYDFAQSRNIAWRSIVRRHGKPVVQIMMRGLDWSTACFYERFFIQSFGRITDKTGPLTNMTLGGDGTVGFRPTIHTRQKLAEITRLNNPARRHRDRVSIKTKEAMQKPEIRQRHLQACQSEDFRKKVSDKTKEALSSKEVRNRISQKVKDYWNKPGLRESRSGSGNRRSKPIVQVDQKGNQVARFDNAYHAQRETGFQAKHINMVLRGHRKTLHGFRWEYEKKSPAEVGYTAD